MGWVGLKTRKYGGLGWVENLVGFVGLPKMDPRIFEHFSVNISSSVYIHLSASPLFHINKQIVYVQL